MELSQELAALVEKAKTDISAARTPQELQDIKSAVLGKKGAVGEYMTRLRDLPNAQRPAFGALVHSAKEELEARFEEKRREIEIARIEATLRANPIDVTLPGLRFASGGLHPIMRVWYEICDIFVAMGFDVVEGPEIETEWHNFEALNLHADHPARDQQDSFYLTDTLLLRTQTSPVQIRTMKERGKPPVQVIAPGRTFRRDAVDASHSPVFHQVEGLMLDRGISMAHLKAVLDEFARQMFGADVRTRLRPDFFPFTEPSCEVAITCIICGGSGCSLCSRTGWLEILGAGMVHPQVIRNGGFDPKECSGFAFGMGIERIALLKYAIDDIRLLNENNVQFLCQFHV